MIHFLFVRIGLPEDTSQNIQFLTKRAAGNNLVNWPSIHHDSVLRKLKKRVSSNKSMENVVSQLINLE